MVPLYAPWFVLLAILMQLVPSSAYPITASWFRDRYSREEWAQALDSYQKFGADSIWQRAPPIIKRTEGELSRNPNFVWCGSTKSATKVTGTRCWEEARSELSSLGLKVSGFLTYEYEEDFGKDVMLCPKYDRRLNSSRIYYRIVLPTTRPRTPCDFPQGSEVYVLFTTFSGTDSHSLLLEGAYNRSMNVYFGLPAFPVDSGGGFDTTLTDVYFAWVDRILFEHKQRYSRLTSREISLYSTLKGYYSTDEVCLAQVTPGSKKQRNLAGFYLNLYKNLGQMIRRYQKEFVLSPFIDLNLSELNATVSDHVRGFTAIANLGVVDVIAVQEGRGAGKGCYFWDTQIDLPVKTVDPMLYEILRYRQPTISPGVTYRQAFSASNQQVFRAFGTAHDLLVKQGVPFEFWLNVEAFEYVRDDPCLPVDPSASGMGELLERTSKSRVDRAITVAGADVQKIISFSWDADYLCVTRKYNKSLASEIIADKERPIISNCSFHSPYNLSVVVLGYNLDGETQSFKIKWTDTSGRNRTDTLYGYYFELDYGERNDRVTSLQYVMLWDTYDWQEVRPKGHVTVQAAGAYNDCIYSYDYS
ncbi:uncharacterized protein LOC135482131 [Liolophura sinensis]|uniref:uncharacterized protein LOC135482131 n=1 Tax=Liolophura sinensis TaxID=3198878 RepID=UPI003158D40C